MEITGKQNQIFTKLKITMPFCKKILDALANQGYRNIAFNVGA